MRTEESRVLSEKQAQQLKAALLTLRDDNLRDLARARDQLAALGSDHSIASASLRDIAANADYMVSDALGIIALVDAALDRIEAGTYGICPQCGEPIPAERLELRPYSMTCVPCSS